MPRLKRVDPSDAGIGRRGRGRGFEYLSPDGDRMTDPDVIARIRSLAIPPAWRDVWICPHPMGHIQATGTDDAGRRQYRYHDRWRERRDREKFDSMVDFARSLSVMRKRVARDLRRDGMERKRVLACAVRLLELGFFRIGGEEYAAGNDSYGLATMLKTTSRSRATRSRSTIRPRAASSACSRWPTGRSPRSSAGSSAGVRAVSSWPTSEAGAGSRSARLRPLPKRADDRRRAGRGRRRSGPRRHPRPGGGRRPRPDHRQRVGGDREGRLDG